MGPNGDEPYETGAEHEMSVTVLGLNAMLRAARDDVGLRRPVSLL